MSQKSSNSNDSFKAGATSKMFSATAFDSSDSATFKTRAYHELLENPHIELDGLQRLQENLQRLEDLHGRLQFLMRDISALLRK